VSHETTLKVSSPIKEGRIDTYGFRGSNFRQEIWITLEQSTPISKVIDLSIFGDFKPGMTMSEAKSVAGKPVSQRKNMYKENIYVYKQGDGAVEFSCESYGSSFDFSLSPAPCVWRVRAVPSMKLENYLLDPQFDTFLAKANSVGEKVDYQTLHINTENNSQFILLIIRSDYRHSIEWFDRTKMRTDKPGV
jgi:hypothetical protein